VRFKPFNLLIVLVVALLVWLIYDKASFTMKLKDNPGWTTSRDDLLKPGGVDSMVIVPLRDGLDTIIPTPYRPFYLKGENDIKLNFEIACYKTDGSVFNQFKTSIPAKKVNALGNQEIKIDPPLNCKGRETTVKFTADTDGAAISPDGYFSVYVEGVHLPFYYNKVYLKEILKEINGNLKKDKRFRILYYSAVGSILFLIMIFSLFESKSESKKREKK